VQVRVRAARTELVCVRDGVLVARVSAPPVDGRANRALCDLIADAVGVAGSRVQVIRGERSRLKVVRVDGVTCEHVLAALHARTAECDDVS
jgi:uncharacterized protein YggU (UPF0235/DUF167 family)